MDNAFPLAPLQAYLWRQIEGAPGSVWASSLTVTVRGPLAPERLATALDELVQRHEILRTRFARSADGAVRQEVAPDGRAACAFLEHGALAPEARGPELTRVEGELRAACTPGAEPALRAALVRFAPDEHALILSMSPLAADGRSLWNLVRELAQLLDGRHSSEEATQFADVARWLCDEREGEDAAAGRALWQRLDLAPAHALRCALEFERGPSPFAPRELEHVLAPATRASLDQLAQRRSLPPQALLCALWQVLLARSAERDEFLLSVRCAGRTFEGLEEVLGTFERFLPVPVRLDERVTLLQLARRADEALAQASEWHEFLAPHGSDVLPRYAFEHRPAFEAFELGGRSFEPVRRGGESEPYRALLRYEERGDGPRLVLAHDPRFLSPADAGVLLEEYLTLLEHALARPEAPLSTLPATSPAMRARILAELACGPARASDARPLHERVVERARTQPAAVAVSARGVELTYGELAERSAALAARLAAAGVGAGAFVGVHLERSVELVVALLGVLRAGAAYVPLPPSYPRERVLFMLADSGAEVVVGGPRTGVELTGFRGTVVSVADARAPAPVFTAPPIGAEDLAYVIYTSGSTGKPKGVPITHANLAHSTDARLAYYAEPVTGYLLLSSFAFDSSVAGLFWTLAAGGTLVLPPEGFEQDLTQLPELIARTRPSHLLGLPSLWSLVLEQARHGELASLRTVIVAGESCPSELVRRHRRELPGVRLFNEYGPTEGTVWSTAFDTAEPFERAAVPIGRPIPGARNYVLDPQREPAPIGMAGELWIAGPGVARGYLGRPELTSERFAEDPFHGGRMYRTGDRARLLSDGNLEFLGRADQQVKIRGYRIELEEIESALTAHPAVREALVVARTENGAAQLVAYTTPIGSRPAEPELVRFLKERLPEYMVPARVLCLERWPLLPNGKVDRNALPAPEAATAFVEPEGALETVLAALWADVLGCERVGRHDDFFALGGHSLSATRLYARLKETLQFPLPLRALFELRTPAALADELVREPTRRERIQRLAELVLSVLEPAEDAEEERALGA